MTSQEQSNKIEKLIHDSALEFVLDNPRFLDCFIEIEAAMLMGAILATTVMAESEQEPA